MVEFNEEQTKVLAVMVEMWFSEGFVSSYTKEQKEIAEKLGIDLNNINDYLIP